MCAELQAFQANNPYYALYHKKGPNPREGAEGQELYEPLLTPELCKARRSPLAPLLLDVFGHHPPHPTETDDEAGAAAPQEREVNHNSNAIKRQLRALLEAYAREQAAGGANPLLLDLSLHTSAWCNSSGANEPQPRLAGKTAMQLCFCEWDLLSLRLCAYYRHLYVQGHLPADDHDAHAALAPLSTACR
ncbi:hypothetical protein STCU_10588 [Strigomonas culicis]|uniref:Uncharacterized protein n=1 Tax=Strigomonas culicis TaxID=28005 RepID=S9TKZ7_9TRYP|nr:hypothetical protein STCU_10588 [Strigomonas culicis]|eukprot:EPY17489.1 hypothetical protein STCU_10588 [Strigomonas culicis]